MKAMRKREADERQAARQQLGDANQTPLGVKQVPPALVPPALVLPGFMGCGVSFTVPHHFHAAAEPGSLLHWRRIFPGDTPVSSLPACGEWAQMRGALKGRFPGLRKAVKGRRLRL